MISLGKLTRKIKGVSMEMANQQILITGATGGIGRAFSFMCARNQAHLHLVCRKPEEDLVLQLKLAGALSVTVWTADLSL